MSTFVYNDGGRSKSGFKGLTGDCVCRAICIVTGLDYREVYDLLTEGNYNQRVTKRSSKKKRSAGDGVLVKRKWFKDYMNSLGFEYVPTMGIGTGCKVHLSSDELPKGKIICQVSRHFVAVIDGVIHDTYNPSRGGNRCVYGYWRLKNS